MEKGRFVVMIGQNDCADYNHYGIANCECQLESTVLRVFDRFQDGADTPMFREILCKELSRCPVNIKALRDLFWCNGKIIIHIEKE